MLVPKQGTTWKLQSRVKTEQNVLERAMANRQVIHNRAKTVTGQELTQTPQSPAVLAQSCLWSLELARDPVQPY